ncbi:MAG: restriction endonuclease subunit S [Candidatus Izemoplasmatales bacterium]
MDKEWKEFKIKELFDVSGTVTTHPTELISDGKTPRITTAASNNGLESFYRNKATEKGGVLTVDSATIGYVSYQYSDFITTDHVEKISFKGERFIPKTIGLFLKTCIDKSKGEKFGYGYKFSQFRINRQIISLPVDKNGEPDYAYMNKYILIQQIKEQYKVINYYYSLID